MPEQSLRQLSPVPAWQHPVLILLTLVVGIAVVAAVLWSISGDRSLLMLHIDGLAVTVWVFSSLITVVIGAYSRRYIDPSDGRERFLVRMLAFLITVWLFAAADHLALLVGAWVSMVWLMVGFVRHDPAWGVGNRSHQYVLRWFALAAVGLVASSGALWCADVTHLSALDTSLLTIPQPVAWVIATGVILTAVIQGGLFPMQRWLVVSMSAPTPASALMHAGFVNAGAIIIIRMAPVLDHVGWALPMLAILGATAAIMGGLFQQVTVDRKLQLAGSTSSQMGFMLLQLGMGLATAAVAHLMLHGWYKAARFLSIGDLDWLEREFEGDSKPRTSVIVLAVLLGTTLFVLLTRKLLTGGTGWLLVGFVVVMLARGALALERRPIPPVPRVGMVLGATVTGTGGYAVIYRIIDPAVTSATAGLDPVAVAPIHIALLAGFAAGGAAIQLGIGRSSRRIYVWLVDQLQVPSDIWGATS